MKKMSMRGYEVETDNVKVYAHEHKCFNCDNCDHSDRGGKLRCFIADRKTMAGSTCSRFMLKEKFN